MFCRARFLPLLQSAEEDCLLVVVGTKLDLLNAVKSRPIPRQDAILLATEINSGNLGSVPYFETSSITGQNVNKVFEYILNHCLPLDDTGENDVRKPAMKSSSVIDLEKSSIPQTRDRKACC